MELLSRYTFKLGLRVKLIRPDDFYVIGIMNPVANSKYECSGCIIHIYKGLCCVKVKWDNGKTNHYKENELSISDSPSAGSCCSIW